MGAVADNLASRGPNMRVAGVVNTWPMPWTATHPLVDVLLADASMDASTMALSYAPPPNIGIDSAAPPATPARSTLFGELAALRGWRGSAPVHGPLDSQSSGRYGAVRALAGT